jgi:plastocyanin
MRRRMIAFLLLLPQVSPVLAATPLVIIQKDRAFSVKEMQIHRGDTIRFSNDDEFGHQIYVQSPGFSFESDEADPGRMVDVPFPAAGDFEVHCHIHPKMRLNVHVD